MQTLSVGQPFPGLPKHFPEGVRFAAGVGGLEMVATVSDPTPQEIRAWKRGKLRLGLLEAGHHVMFLLYELEGFCGWSDASFATGLQPADRRSLPPRDDRQGRLLTVVMAEHGTSIIRAIRAVSVSHTFAAALDGGLARQVARLSSFTPSALNAEIDAAYQHWPDACDMVRDASVVETAGKAHV